jgi:hypothetical protein
VPATQKPVAAALLRKERRLCCGIMRTAPGAPASFRGGPGPVPGRRKDSVYEGGYGGWPIRLRPACPPTADMLSSRSVRRVLSIKRESFVRLGHDVYYNGSQAALNAAYRFAGDGAFPARRVGIHPRQVPCNALALYHGVAIAQ